TDPNRCDLGDHTLESRNSTMIAPSVRKLAFDAAQITPWGPAHVEDRYKDADLTALGASFVVFDEEGETERWTYERDELLYVVEGELHVTIFDCDGTIDCGPGDLIQIKKGSDLSYRGTKGTRLLLAFAPLD
ncbi:cupin domain-containing protein, partial [Mycolicibacterium sp. CBMA 361]|uniref:cupin domain-containing protein n=2 Tax=Mycolicibacterium TaxID=1866885 RepID=UPI00193DA0AA